MKRYRVTQLDSWGEIIHSQTYRWKWMARLSAWIHTGPDPITGRTYKTVIHEVGV